MTYAQIAKADGRLSEEQVRQNGQVMITDGLLWRPKMYQLALAAPEREKERAKEDGQGYTLKPATVKDGQPVKLTPRPLNHKTDEQLAKDQSEAKKQDINSQLKALYDLRSEIGELWKISANSPVVDMMMKPYAEGLTLTSRIIDLMVRKLQDKA